MSKYFEFDTKAKILSGDNALSHILFELEIRNKKKPLILSDEGLKGLGVVDKSIKKMNIENYSLFTSVPTDSSTDTVNEVTAFYKKEKCDSIIALGGGSVIDTAKGAVLSLVAGTTDIAKLEGADRLVKNNNILIFSNLYF